MHLFLYHGQGDDVDESADHLLDIYDELHEEMVGLNNFDPSNINMSDNIDDSDLAELQSVNERLDQLATVLDFFEERTENIIEQLKDLLHSNREIRQQLANETAALAEMEEELAEQPKSTTPDNDSEENVEPK